MINKMAKEEWRNEEWEGMGMGGGGMGDSHHLSWKRGETGPATIYLFWRGMRRARCRGLKLSTKRKAKSIYKTATYALSLTNWSPSTKNYSARHLAKQGLL